MAKAYAASSERPALRLAARTAAFALGLAAATGAGAQVLEIGDDGAVAVYDRPAVFTETGVQPIAAPKPAPPSFSPARLAPIRVAPSAAPRPEVLQQLSEAASAYALSPELVHAVAWKESRFRHNAVSPKGATGVMQLMPGTARAMGVDRFDLRQNIYGGAFYLRRMLDEFGGDVALGLAAYNAGPGAVRRYGGVPPYAETRDYVASILGRIAVQAAAPNPIR